MYEIYPSNSLALTFSALSSRTEKSFREICSRLSLSFKLLPAYLRQDDQDQLDQKHGRLHQTTLIHTVLVHWQRAGCALNELAPFASAFSTEAPPEQRTCHNSVVFLDWTFLIHIKGFLFSILTPYK
jgi:hypothetical protein